MLVPAVSVALVAGIVEANLSHTRIVNGEVLATGTELIRIFRASTTDNETNRVLFTHGGGPVSIGFYASLDGQGEASIIGNFSVFRIGD